MTTFNQMYDWSFLPHFIIRSTGFPFQLLEELTFDNTNKALQQLLHAERHLAEWENAFRTLWEEEPTPTICKAQQRLHKKISRRDPDLSLHALDLPQSLIARLEKWVDGWKRRLQLYQDQKSAALLIFNEELLLKRCQLQRIVSLPAYQEAVFLSSSDMYHHHIRSYLVHPVDNARTSDKKRVERRLFSYLQRFCGKNETSSFFGPLNYGQIDDAREILLDAQREPHGLIQQREVFLSFWAVKALAEAIKKDERLFDDLPLRLHAMAEIMADNALYLHTHQRRLPLYPWLRAIDGKKSSKDLLSANEPKYAQQLETLIRSGIIQRELHIPSTIAHPLSYLLNQIRQLPPSSASQQWEEVCLCWQQWCREMEKADLAQRIVLVQQGERLFTEQTKEPARRGQGNLYADRYIFYEETKGHINHFIFGKPFHDTLRRQLRGALELSAMLGYHEWLHYQSLSHQIFLALSPDKQPVPFFSFIGEARQRYPQTPAPSRMQEQLHIEQLIRTRMEHSLTHRIDLNSQELPIKEYEGELYSLPDIFLAASSIEELERGAYQVILGKLHHHLLLPGWLTQFYPATEQLQNDVMAHLAASTSFQILVCPEVVRRNKGFYRFPGKVIAFSEHPLKEQGDIIPLYDIEVFEDEQGMLRLRRRTTRELLALYISLADQVRYLPFATFALPALTQMTFSLGEHTPRIEIDGVVYQRERWQLSSEQCKAAFSQQPLETLLNIKKLQQKYQIPDWVYVRGSAERKPIVLNLQNFFCLELLQATLEHNESLLIEEMLPGPGQLWLQSDQGKYSCELRMNLFKEKLSPERLSAGAERS